MATAHLSTVFKHSNNRNIFSEKFNHVKGVHNQHTSIFEWVITDGETHYYTQLTFSFTFYKPKDFLSNHNLTF